MKNNILLIGMPGAGKSTVGVILAKTIGYDFIDSDILLCRRIGMTLQSYINTYGIERFLEAEESASLAIGCSETVIATGGSVVLSPSAMAHLKNGAVTVFLDVPLKELINRLDNIGTRGIAVKPGETIGDIYGQRLPLYRRYADVTVAPSDSPNGIEAAVQAVLDLIRP